MLVRIVDVVVWVLEGSVPSIVRNMDMNILSTVVRFICPFIYIGYIFSFKNDCKWQTLDNWSCRDQMNCSYLHWRLSVEEGALLLHSSHECTTGASTRSESDFVFIWKTTELMHHTKISCRRYILVWISKNFSAWLQYSLTNQIVLQRMRASVIGFI